MTFFGRKRNRKRQEDAARVEAEAQEVTGQSDIPVSVPGPRDSEGKPAPSGYVDLGSLYVPSVPGMQLRAQFEADKVSVRRILLVVGTSGIQVSVAAAPRSGGVWSELSQQIEQSFLKAGGTVEFVEGRYGTELQAVAALTLPNGGKGMSPMRVIGVEGPRWVARIDIQGAAAAGDEEQAALCDEIIDQLIVHRGSEPRVRLESLPMKLPRERRATEADSN